jgi:drug/metabolite transporter (DMT)-like permease
VIVAGSMYPAVTVGLAAVFLGERIRFRQSVGIAAALVGVALMSLD